MFQRIFSFALPTFRRRAAHCRLGIGLWALALFLVVHSTHAFAATITFAWDPIPDSDLAGYRLYYGYASGQYSLSVDAGTSTTAALSDMDDAQIYFFAVAAYDTAGNQSAFSNEIKYDLAVQDTDGDGLSDWDEVSFYKTDPDRADTDGDGLSDGAEVNVRRTDPTRADTDGDGVSDGAEVSQGSNPLDAASIPGQGGVLFSVNSGGAKYVGTDGVVYQADARFSGGRTDSTSVAIANTTNGPLYQSWRYGNPNFSYAVPLEDGDYLVTLKFADNLWSQAGQRVFNVSMEGKVVLSNLDVAAKVGLSAAYDVTLPVTVTDGTLTIGFQPVVGNPMVSGIVVIAK
jgi:hypothetical protein